MNLKKIIREEIKNDLQWIKDINPIPEIKIGTCIVDEMAGGIEGEKWVIKSIRENPSWTIIEVVNSKGKSVTLNKKYFEEHLLYGRYKGCGKSMKESNDFQWIKDTESDEDIAQEIVDETEIVKDANGNFRIESDFDSYPIEDFYYDYATYFIDYLKSNYGIEDLNRVSRIWKRYKKGVATKIDKEYPIGGVNESNDFDWIKDIDSKVDEETIDILYNKPFYWYSPLEKSKWVTFQGMPKIYWLEDGIDSAEVKVCTHKHNKEGFYVKDCDPQSSSTVAGKFNRGVYVLQPKLTNINESKNDFGWVDEIPQYDFHNGEYYIDISQLDDDEACEVQQTLINMGIDWREGNGKINKLHCSTFTNKGYIIRKAVLYRTTKSYDDYRDELFRNTPWDVVYIDGRTDLLG